MEFIFNQWYSVFRTILLAKSSSNIHRGMVEKDQLYTKDEKKNPHFCGMAFITFYNASEKCLLLQFVCLLSVACNLPSVRALTLVNIARLSRNWCMLFRFTMACSILKMSWVACMVHVQVHVIHDVQVWFMWVLKRILLHYGLREKWSDVYLNGNKLF